MLSKLFFCFMPVVFVGAFASAQFATLPSITGLAPDQAEAGGGAFVLSVSGGAFVRGSTVLWKGSARPTTFANSGQLRAAITAVDIATAGWATITVITPGVGSSNARGFKIYVPCGQPLSKEGSYKGEVAKSNGKYQGKARDCASIGQWECVEYVKRFYGNVLMADIAKWGADDARYYYAHAGHKGLLPLPNPGPILPVQDDILSFDGGSAGHVAIVTGVSEAITQEATKGYTVNFIEQNWSVSGLASLPLSVKADSTYSMEPRAAKDTLYPIQGWLRKPSATLTISTSDCAPGPSCRGNQGTIFEFNGNGFTPGGKVRKFTQTIVKGDITLTEVLPALTATDNTISWSFNSCLGAAGDFSIFALDEASGKVTNIVTESIVPASCTPPTPELSVTPTSPYDFSVAIVGQPRTQTFTIWNTGTATLTVSSITFDSADFYVDPSVQVPFDVPYGQNNTFAYNVAFKPATTGFRHGTMTIASNAGSVQIALSGTGVNPPPPPPTSYQGGGPPGGFVRAVAVDPNNPAILYASTTTGPDEYSGQDLTFGGPMFKSSNGGLAWTPLTTYFGDDIVWAITVDPTNSATIYAGTDKSVFKTTDGGQHWFPMASGLPAFPVHVLTIDPTNASRIYAGTRGRGVFKTIDGGTTWVPANQGLTDSVLGAEYQGSIYVLALTIDRSNRQMVYAGVIGGGSFPVGGLFKSVNGGLSWTPANSGLLDPLRGWGASITAIVVDPQDPNVIYAGATADVGGGVLKSTDGGQTWNWLKWGAGDAVSALIGDPLNAKVLHGIFFQSGVMESADAGVTWVSENSGLPDNGAVAAGEGISSITFSPDNTNVLYVGTHAGVFKRSTVDQSWAAINSGIAARDVRSIALDPTTPAIAYVGGAGSGLFRTNDGGATWTDLHSTAPLMFPDRDTISTFAIDPIQPATLYAGLLEESAILKSIDGGSSWTKLNDQYFRGTTDILIEPDNPSALYTSAFPSNGVLKSFDAGQTWELTSLYITSSLPNLALAMDATGAIYVASYGGPGWDNYGGVFKSPDAGQTWTSKLQSVSMMSMLAVPTGDPNNPTVLYAGCQVGCVYRSSDNGDTWSRFETGIDYGTGIRALAADPLQHDTIYAGTFGAGVLKSTNGGQTWSDSSYGLTNKRITALAIDQQNPQKIYATTFGAGVFKSIDGGQTWQPTNAN